MLELSLNKLNSTSAKTKWRHLLKMEGIAENYFSWCVSTLEGARGTLKTRN